MSSMLLHCFSMVWLCIPMMLLCSLTADVHCVCAAACQSEGISDEQALVQKDLHLQREYRINAESSSEQGRQADLEKL